MFIQIQDSIFNLNNVAHITINKVNRNYLEVYTNLNHNNYHSFKYNTNQEAKEVLDKLYDTILRLRNSNR
jgi:hypothetical protein